MTIPKSKTKQQIRNQTQVRAKASIASRNGRVEEYQRLVKPIAAFYASCTPEPFDDLLQVGLMGLMRAAELYCSSNSAPFEAFAKPHVRGAILHYLPSKSILWQAGRKAVMAAQCGSVTQGSAPRSRPMGLRLSSR